MSTILWDGGRSTAMLTTTVEMTITVCLQTSHTQAHGHPVIVHLKRFTSIQVLLRTVLWEKECLAINNINIKFNS